MSCLNFVRSIVIEHFDVFKHCRLRVIMCVKVLQMDQCSF
jgi:hypothetical protein